MVFSSLAWDKGVIVFCLLTDKGHSGHFWFIKRERDVERDRQRETRERKKERRESRVRESEREREPFESVFSVNI